ncbi:MAG: aminoacyl-tRNA hydrolase [Nitrospirae bacterium]|nr:aminoacyl-tRNA hydrolase [Nitrospirota bacterium]
MWAIIGLGNPGAKYRHTRHNAGFDVTDYVAGQYRIILNKKGEAMIGTGTIEGQDVIVVQPLTYMNLSGRVAGRFARDDPDRAIVVHDDMDMETGRLRIKRGGSAGGHRGVQSIIEQSGTKDFVRVKIGIGRPDGVATEDYVLTRFHKKERELVEESIGRAAEAIAAIISNGVQWAMNKFNRAGLSINP